MSQLIPKEAPKPKGVREKVGYKAAGIFLFVSVFAVNSAQADSKQDIADLEAFYWQVFPNKKKAAQNTQHKTAKHFSKKTNSPKNSIPSPRAYSPPNKKEVVKKASTAVKLQQHIDDLKGNKTATYRPLVIPKRVPAPVFNNVAQKDPELVAFYEYVFGKDSRKKVSVNKPAPKKENVKVSKEQRNASTLQKIINDSKKTKITPIISKTIKNNKVKKSAFSAKITTLSNQASSFDYKSSDNDDTLENNESQNTASLKVSTSSEVELQGLIDNIDSSNVTSIHTKKLDNATEKTTKNIQTVKEDIDDEQKEIDAEEETNQATSQTKNLNDLFAKAFGKKRKTSVPTNVTVDLKINKTKLGDVTVFSNKQGAMSKVGTKGILPLLNKLLKDKTYEVIKEKLSTKKNVSFYALNKLGVKARYNPVDLSLDLTIKSHLRKPLILSMGSKRNVSVRKDNKITSDEVSAYLNMYTNVGLLSGSGNKPDINMKLEGSLNIKNTVLESTIDLRGGKVSGQKTTLTYDKPEKLQRFMLGNVSTGNKNFQENLRIDGIRLSKEFFMEPELQIRPKANESFVLDSDSEIEVFINNQLRQRFYLRAGIYSLEDIGLYDGANNIRVRIKDEFGKITVKTSQQYYDSHLLKKGLSLYAITVGYLSNKQTGVNNQLIRDPIISGYYQKGISKDLTLGFDAQISRNSFLLGSELIAPITLGSIKTSIAISGGEGKSAGAAARFEFKPNRKHEKIGLDTLRQDMLTLERRKQGFLNSWTVSGEVRSKDFSLLNGSDSIDLETGNIKKKLKARLQTNFNLTLSDNWRGNLNLGVSDYYDAQESASANLTATKRFDNGMSLSLGARYDSEEDFSMNLQLSIPLFREKGKRKKDLDFIVDSKDSTFESKLSIKPTSIVGKNSIGGSLEHIQTDTSRQQKLDIYYRNTNFETNFKARNRFSKKNNESFQQLNLGFNTSLACVGSSCATSFPIEDSFALVAGPSNQKDPIAINDGNLQFKYSDGNDTGLPDSYTALIPDKDSKAVVQLDSYRFQNINIDESTLPNGYDSEKTEFEVFPKYHQGFLIKAGGEPNTILNGVLVDESNKILGFKGGQWAPVSGKGKVIAFFSNKAGRFRINSIPAGNYKLDLFDYPDMETINVAVPDLKGKVHDLGNLIIKE